MTKVVHIRSCRYPNSLVAEAGPRAIDCQSYSRFLNSSLAPPEVGEPCSQAEDPDQSESGQDPSHILLKKKSAFDGRSHLLWKGSFIIINPRL